MMSCEFHIEASLENGKFPHRSRRNFAGQGPLEEEEDRLEEDEVRLEEEEVRLEEEVRIEEDEVRLEEEKVRLEEEEEEGPEVRLERRRKSFGHGVEGDDSKFSLLVRL